MQLQTKIGIGLAAAGAAAAFVVAMWSDGKKIDHLKAMASTVALSVRVTGLVAFVDDGKGDYWALLPNTAIPNNLPAQCKYSGSDYLHAAALRISPDYLTPDTDSGESTEFVVIPLRGEEVQIDTSGLGCKDVQMSDLATMPLVAALSSDLDKVDSDALGSDIDPDLLLGRIKLTRKGVTLGDPTLNSGVDVTWDFTNYENGNKVRYKDLAQLATWNQTCSNYSGQLIVLRLVGRSGTRTINLYPKKNSVDVDVVNFMPSDQFEYIPISHTPADTVPHFRLLYLVAASCKKHKGPCPDPTAENLTTAAGKPYCPFAEFSQ
jgi:hypothetical protein